MRQVVIADDEPVFRQWLRSLLDGSEDFQVVGESITGKDTLGLISHVSPDILIIDVYMPELDGLEVARYVKKHFPAIKTILISAHVDRVYKEMAESEGALTFIPKRQLSLDTLRQALKLAA